MKENKYFQWLCGIVEGDKHREYSRLLRLLFDTPFRYILKRDENRAIDGASLRSRVGYTGTEQCCVLEMLTALAIRIEDSVMTNRAYGDRTAKWFWLMINNLGLLNQVDNCFDSQMVDQTLNRFMDRKYWPNGDFGGLFVIPNYIQDLREVEIWYQAMWYFAQADIK